jgi:hypothetical protein
LHKDSKPNRGKKSHEVVRNFPAFPHTIPIHLPVMDGLIRHKPFRPQEKARNPD